MQVVPYLSFNGQCEAAFTLYAKCLGGTLGEIHRYGGSPMADQAPPDWSDKVMHGSVTLGDRTLMGADMVQGQYEAPKGFSLSVQTNDAAEAERIYRDLSEGGTVIMALEKTFWAERFGMFIDRFGTPWTINCES
jgi:PhnB protein